MEHDDCNPIDMDPLAILADAFQREICEYRTITTDFLMGFAFLAFEKMGDDITDGTGRFRDSERAGSHRMCFTAPI